MSGGALPPTLHKHVAVPAGRRHRVPIFWTQMSLSSTSLWFPTSPSTTLQGFRPEATSLSSTAASELWSFDYFSTTDPGSPTTLQLVSNRSKRPSLLTDSLSWNRPAKVQRGASSDFPETCGGTRRSSPCTPPGSPRLDSINY